MAPYRGFVGPSYTPESKIAAYDRTVNWYPERIESGTGTAQYWLAPTPGYAAAFTLSDAPGRGGFTIADAIYFVSGASFYSTTTFRGNVSNLTNAPVYMVGQGAGINQVLIASDITTYVYNPDTHVFSTVGTANVDPVSIGYLNSYGLRLNPTLTQVEFSAPGDFTSWDPLDVLVREDAPDNWIRLIVFHKEIWLFGTTTTSVYYNDPDDPDTPFKPIQSVFINMGTIAPHSVCIVDGSLMWIGQGDNGGGVVYRANGYTPERVSTFPIEYAFSVASSPLRLFEGETYQENGHTFYVLTLPGIMSWAYDVTTGLWHERGDHDGLGFVGLGTIGQAYLQQNDPEASHYTQSRTTGAVLFQSTQFSVNTDGTSGIVRLRRAPHIQKEHKGVVIDTFELYMEVGLGLGNVISTDPGYDPLIAMRFSNNGGQTWSNTRTVSAGKQGEWNTRPIWTRLGYGRDRIIEVTVSAPVPYRLIDAFVDVRVGAS